MIKIAYYMRIFVVLVIGVLLGLLYSCVAKAGEPTQVRVAILDTGTSVRYKGPLCKEGHKDFTGTTLADKVGHGSEVASIIARQAPQYGWCLISLKYTNANGKPSGVNYVKALEYAATLKLDVLNLSLSGLEPILEEKIAIKKLLDQGVHVVIAAGNRGLNLDLGCVVWPTCIDKRAIVVGSNLPSSNTGTIVDFVVPSVKGPADGTSASAAVISGNLVRLIVEGVK